MTAMVEVITTHLLRADDLQNAKESRFFLPPCFLEVTSLPTMHAKGYESIEARASNDERFPAIDSVVTNAVFNANVF